MADKKKEIVDTTVKCPSCGKVIYQGELCSCKQKNDDPYKLKK